MTQDWDKSTLWRMTAENIQKRRRRRKRPERRKERKTQSGDERTAKVLRGKVKVRMYD